MRLLTNGALKRDLPARVAGRRSESRKVAGQHRCRRNERNSVGWILANRRALVSAEEKQFVLHDRPADRSTELVALDRVALRCKGVPRIEHSIAHELKQIAVKLVRSGLCYQADRPEDFTPFCADVALVSTLNSCSASGNGIERYEPGVLVVVVRAVERVVQSGAQPARDGNIASGERIAIAAGDRGCRRRGSRQREQFDHLPAVQWEFEDAGVLNDLADAALRVSTSAAFA